MKPTCTTISGFTQCARSFVGMRPEKGEVFVISPNEQKVKLKIEVGARPRSVVFAPDGSRAYIACENAGSIAVVEVGYRHARHGVVLDGRDDVVVLSATPDEVVLEVAGVEHRPLHIHSGAREHCPGDAA